MSSADQREAFVRKLYPEIHEFIDSIDDYETRTCMINVVDFFALDHVASESDDVDYFVDEFLNDQIHEDVIFDWEDPDMPRHVEEIKAAVYAAYKDWEGPRKTDAKNDAKAP